MPARRTCWDAHPAWRSSPPIERVHDAGLVATNHRVSVTSGLAVTNSNAAGPTLVTHTGVPARREREHSAGCVRVVDASARSRPASVTAPAVENCQAIFRPRPSFAESRFYWIRIDFQTRHGRPSANRSGRICAWVRRRHEQERYEWTPKDSGGRNSSKCASQIIVGSLRSCSRVLSSSMSTHHIGAKARPDRDRGQSFVEVVLRSCWEWFGVASSDGVALADQPDRRRPTFPAVPEGPPLRMRAPIRSGLALLQW